MKKIILEATKFVEAYKCNNRHYFPIYLNNSSFPQINLLTFYKCCTECGSIEIQIVTGRWAREYEIKGLIFKKKRLVKERFIEFVGGVAMDKYTMTLDEYIKTRLDKGDNDFDIGIRYTNGEVYIDDQSPSRISFKIERSAKPCC